MTDMTLESRLRHSWEANARAWTEVVRGRRIESRRLVTDAAIVEAIVDAAPRRLLDLGCGEGWLAGAIAERLPETAYLGMDASTSLITEARALYPGRDFTVVDFVTDPDALAAYGDFDLAVANFSLLDERLDRLLMVCRKQLLPGSRLLIQTLHPHSLQSKGPLPEAGWRLERFAGFPVAFPEAMPWYFRRPEDWRQLLADTGYGDIVWRDILRPDNGAPASLLLCARRD